MRTRAYRFLILVAVLVAGNLAALPSGPAALCSAPAEEKFEDWAQFHYSGGIVSATGIRDKGGFTVIPLESAEARTKVAVSFALIGETGHSFSDFRIIAVDVAGNRHEAKHESNASASGKGTTVVTLISDFNLASGMIDTLLVQKRAAK